MAQNPVEVKKVTPPHARQMSGSRFGVKWTDCSTVLPSVSVRRRSAECSTSNRLGGPKPKTTRRTRSRPSCHVSRKRTSTSRYRARCSRSKEKIQRSFVLPDGIDRDKIAADVSKGVLTVPIPKTAEAQKQQKKIEVKAAT